MSLHLTRATIDGIKRFPTKTGGFLFVFLLVSQGLLIVAINSLVAAEFPAAVSEELGVGLFVPISANAALALLAGAVLASSVFFVVLARALARPRSELSTVPADLFTRRIVRATISLIIAGAVAFVAITVGLAFFLLPGLFFAACFLFIMFAVGVEDEGPLGALRQSWQLSRGNRIRLGILVILMGLGGGVVGAVPALLDAVGEPVLGDVASILLNGVLYVFLYGIVAAAYLQVAADD